MSSLKEKGKTIAKVPVRVAAIPANVAVPRIVRTNQKFFVDTLKGAHAVPCPFCAHGHLYSVFELSFNDENDYSEEEKEKFKIVNERSKKGDVNIWQCNVCEEHIETETNEVSELVDYIQKNGRKLYENGYAYQRRQQQIESGELNYLVDKRFKYTKFFYALAFICALLFLYGAYRGAVIYSLSILLFGFMLFFMGMSNTYRAWQMLTDSLYTKDPKEQFHWWVKNKNWFVSPTEYEDIETHLVDNEAVDTFVTNEDVEIEDFLSIPDFSTMMFYYYEGPEPIESGFSEGLDEDEFKV